MFSELLLLRRAKKSSRAWDEVISSIIQHKQKSKHKSSARSEHPTTDSDPLRMNRSKDSPWGKLSCQQIAIPRVLARTKRALLARKACSRFRASTHQRNRSEEECTAGWNRRKSVEPRSVPPFSPIHQTKEQSGRASHRFLPCSRILPPPSKQTMNKTLTNKALANENTGECTAIWAEVCVCVITFESNTECIGISLNEVSFPSHRKSMDESCSV